jgi:hypothetical protein
MRRRRFIGTGLGVLSMGAVAGCTGGDAGEEDASPTPTAGEASTPTTGEESTSTDGEGLHDGVYVQQFTDGMAMQGTAEAGDLDVAVMYSAPHQFWRVVGDELEMEPVESDDSLHLMATVWDDETGTVVPETGLTVEIAPAGGAFDEQVIYPMLSQPMGFHYGANFTLDGDGEYAVRVTVGGLNIRRTGAFEGRFGDPAAATVDVVFDEANRQKVGDRTRELDSYGQPGALEPMDMMMPDGVAPPVESMPGDHIGTERSDETVLPAFALRDDPPVGDGAYLYVSPRTPYNGYAIPAAGFEVTVDRGGETVLDGRLERTLDPGLKYHYGAAVGSLAAGDEVTVTPVTPPQVSRHQGYERAFLEMDPVSYTV